jgi:glucosylceramidase
MESYFSRDGIQYNLCRVPIGGTDYSDRPYSYDDGDEDPELKNFELAPEDFKYKVKSVEVFASLFITSFRFLTFRKLCI